MGLLKKLGKVVKKVAGVAAPIIGGAIGGPLGASIGGAVGGALKGSSGAKKAAKASAAGYDAAAAQYGNALMRSQEYMQPYQQAGTAALGSLNRLNAGDYSAFMNSPDYTYARDQALQGVQNSAAARGGLFSGNAGRALAGVASGLASQNLGSYRNALMGQIGIGQNAAGTLVNGQFNAANGIAQGLTGSGDARASGIVGSTNALTSGLQDVAGAVGDYYGNKLVKKPKPVKTAYAWNYKPSGTGNA